MFEEMNNETMDETKVRLEQLFGQSMVGGLRNYIDHGIRPGSFLNSVLTNDLKGAVAHADHKNIRLIPEYSFYLYNYCPGNCWGSPEKVNEYISKKAGF